MAMTAPQEAKRYRLPKGEGSDTGLGVLLPSSGHPNYDLWRNYHLSARHRGELVADILKQRVELNATKILDVGCGAGGTSIALAQRGAKVLAIDTRRECIHTVRHLAAAAGVEVECGVGNASTLQFATASFDCIILQDVIEHVEKPGNVLAEAARVVKARGVIFISTPNRWSAFNLLADPHWQLPLIAALPRSGVAVIVKHLTHRAPDDKRDLAALLSLRRLRSLCKSSGLKPSFVNEFVAHRATADARAVFSSRLHLKLAHIAARTPVTAVLEMIVNDRWRFFNYVINPTWYMLASKP